MGEGGIWAYFGCCALCANRSSSNALKGALVGTFWAASYRTYLALAHAREADPSFSLYDQVTNVCPYSWDRVVGRMNHWESQVVDALYFFFKIVAFCT